MDQKFQDYFKGKKVTVMGLVVLGNPSVFRRSLVTSLTAFRHGEPTWFPDPLLQTESIREILNRNHGEI